MTTIVDDLSADFRQAMAHLCAPVSVITTMDGDRPHGTTVSAVMSLSMDPLLVAVALAESSQSLTLIRRSLSFGVNILSAPQDAIAGRFAGKGEEKFADVDWSPTDSGPRLDGSAVWLGCELAELLPGGDHTILVGRVRHAETAEDLAPLTYHRRSFGTHRAHA